MTLTGATQRRGPCAASFSCGATGVLHQIVEEEHAARVSADMARRKRRQRERADIAQAQFDAQRAAPRPATAALDGGGI